MSESIWNDPRITAYALGELSDEERELFEAELVANPALVAAVTEVQSLTQQLQSHYTHESIPGLDASRREAIFAQPSSSGVGEQAATLFRSKSPGGSTQRSWFAQHGLKLAVAASLVFVIVGLVAPATNAVRKAARRDTDRVAMEIKTEPMPEQVGASDDGSDMRGGYVAESLTPAQSPEVEPPASAPSSPFLPESTLELQKTPAMPEPQRPLSASDIAAAKSSKEFRMSISEASSSISNQPAEEMRSKSVDAFGMGMGLGAPPNVGDVAASTLADSDAKVGGRFPESNRQRLSRSKLRETNPTIADASDIKVVPRGLQLMVTPGIIIEEEEAKPQTGLGTDLFGEAIPEGRGPGNSGDQFAPITDNPFQRVSEHPLSTFSADVDTASYSKIRDFLVRANQLPRPDAVRIEEMLNYFDYNYAPPESNGAHPFATHAEIVSCPWNDSHRLARIAVKGKTVSAAERPACNLVFLLDTSGSMDAPNKAPLVQEGMKMLLSQLSEKDRVAMVVYAGSAGLVLESTPASKSKKIRRALTQLATGGSTNGGAGIALAYQTARDHFIQDGVNRVILCTDGDFNVGTTGTDALVRMVEDEAKGGVFLTVLGFGMGNHNDAMLEQISGRGNGNYAFIDTANEAKKVLVEQTEATLVTIAKDVKFQVEFNPAHVSAYRLIGYENRMLAKEDFNDDQKDAGEIGAGHTVTALYEIVPAGIEVDAIAPEVDELKYQKKLKPTEAAGSNESLTVKLRYKKPDGDTSTLVDFPVVDSEKSFTEADDDVRFAAAVAGFGMKLRRSTYAGSWTFADIEKVAENAKGTDRFGLRAELVELVRKASSFMGQER